MNRPSYFILMGRALRLKCPRCGRGRLFTGLFTMPRHCPECGFMFERAPGYFLGSTYINYGFTALSLTAIYMGFHFGLGYSNEVLTPALVAYCIVVPMILFRYARAWWLAMDCYLDTTGMSEGRPAEPPWEEPPA